MDFKEEALMHLEAYLELVDILIEHFEEDDEDAQQDLMHLILIRTEVDWFINEHDEERNQ